jgi:hypothetical protein
MIERRRMAVTNAASPSLVETQDKEGGTIGQEWQTCLLHNRYECSIHLGSLKAPDRNVPGFIQPPLIVPCHLQLDSDSGGWNGGIG